MGALKRCGMKAACDEIIATAVKRLQEPERTVGDLFSAEIAASRRARYRAPDLRDLALRGL
jgi:hypothetical protein